MTQPHNAPDCPECGEPGRRGYCAPMRCYCGHDACPAIESWQPRPELNVTALEPRMTRPNVWADREESTWIDRM